MPKAFPLGHFFPLVKVPPLQQTEERKERGEEDHKRLVEWEKKKRGEGGKGNFTACFVCERHFSSSPFLSPLPKGGERKGERILTQVQPLLLPTRVLRAKGKVRKECKYWSWRHSLYRTGRGVSPKVRNTYSSFSGQTFSLPHYFVFCHTHAHTMRR